MWCSEDMWCWFTQIHLTQNNSFWSDHNPADCAACFAICGACPVLAGWQICILTAFGANESELLVVQWCQLAVIKSPKNVLMSAGLKKLATAASWLCTALTRETTTSMVLSTISVHQATMSLQKAQYNAQPLGSHAKQSVLCSPQLSCTWYFVTAIQCNTGCCKEYCGLHDHQVDFGLSAAVSNLHIWDSLAGCWVGSTTVVGCL